MKDCCCIESAQSHEFKYAKVFEGLSQGVCAGVFSKTQNCEESSGGVAPLKCSKEDKVKLIPREIRVEVIHHKLSSSGRTFVYFVGIIKEQRVVENLCGEFMKSQES